MDEIMKHVITAMVENRPGVLARVVGLISGRGFNIDSLNVAPTQDPSVSRMTIQVPGDARVLEQVTKQLNKLVDVIKVSDLTSEHYLAGELILIKVAASRTERAELHQLATMTGAKVMSVNPKSIVLQMTGSQDEIADFITLLKSFKILDISRSGIIAVTRTDGETEKEGRKK